MNYTVKSGDSLSIIARDVLGNMSLWPEIAHLNNLSDPYTIFPGQVLVLPDVSASSGAGSGASSGSFPWKNIVILTALTAGGFYLYKRSKSKSKLKK